MLPQKIQSGVKTPGGEGQPRAWPGALGEGFFLLVSNRGVGVGAADAVQDQVWTCCLLSGC